MGYQALLFCPDEKTARTVTQVLGELDFEVSSCTEPFAAVKKLMSERFDAVVVDCDNEQNATLLYKSARNAPNNHSALAVAVVEGQAGVAKAFRIGANLVLTKPINVEQAKGTLRVARGLLRKNESTKAPSPVSAATSTLAPALSTTPKLVASLTSPSENRPAASAAHAAAPALIALHRDEPAVAQVSPAVAEPTEVGEAALPSLKITPVLAEAAAQPQAIVSPATLAESKPELSFGKKEDQTSPNPGFPASPASGAGSAPAPALDPKPAVKESEPGKAAPVPVTPKNISDVAESVTEDAEEKAVGPVFALGASEGAVEPSSGSKKALLGVAAVILIAAAGYAAYTKYGNPLSRTNSSAPPVVQPVASSAQIPTTPIAATNDSPFVTPAASAEPASPSGNSAVDSSTTQTAKSVLTQESVPTKAKAAQNKLVGEPSSLESQTPSATANKPTPATPPLVVKNGGSIAPAQKSDTADASAPAITTIASDSNNGPLPNLMSGASSAPTPVLQSVNISQGVSQGLLIKKTSPNYPANALRLGIEGPVTLLATISKTGDISAVKILKGDQNLARAAAEAVKQWKYKPYLLDGSPVEIQTQITVNFKLPK